LIKLNISNFQNINNFFVLIFQKKFSQILNEKKKVGSCLFSLLVVPESGSELFYARLSVLSQHAEVVHLLDQLGLEVVSDSVATTKGIS
jgi:hypothetical protein